MNKDLIQWLQDNPGMKARYDAAPAEARRMLELWATLDAGGKKAAAQLIQAAALQEGNLARELKLLAEQGEAWRKTFTP